MRPSAPKMYLRDSRLADTILLCHIILLNAIGNKLAHLKHFSFIQLCAWVRGAKCASTSFGHLLAVIFGSTNAKMVGVDARRVVAAMQNKQAIRNKSDKVFVREPMRSSWRLPPTHRELPVSLGGFKCCPQPAPIFIHCILAFKASKIFLNHYLKSLIHPVRGIQYQQVGG